MGFADFCRQFLARDGALDHFRTILKVNDPDRGVCIPVNIYDLEGIKLNLAFIQNYAGNYVTI